MSWITVIWSATAGICLTLAGVHLVVWLKSRESWANLLFAISAAAAAVCPFIELALMHSNTPAEFSVWLRWLHVPAGILVVSMVWFMRLYLRAGRLWLAWLITILRGTTLVLTFSLTPNLNFRTITGLKELSVLGQTVVMPIGEKNPWTNITHLAMLLLLVFVVDAAITAWRRERHRQALVLAGSVVLAALVGVTLSELLNRGALPIPFSVSIIFLIVVLGIAYELGNDLLRGRQVSLELRETQQRMSQAASAAELSFWEWDLLRDEVWVTGKSRERYGIGESEPVNLERVLERVHPEDRKSTRQAIQQALDSRKSFEAEYRIIVPDGATRWIAARGDFERGDNDEPRRLRGVSMDITNRKQAEIALRESEERFRQVANTAPVMIWMSGTDKLCHYFNKGWLDYTGRTLEQELGNGWIEGVHPDDFKQCLDIYTTSFDARRGFNMEYRLRKRYGGYGWVLDTGVPRFAADGQFLGYIGSCIDITAQKDAGALHRDLAHASRVSTLGQLSTALAHELNQPLGAILSNAEAAEMLLDADPPSLDQVREILTDIRKDDERAGEVIRRMRALLHKREMEVVLLDLGDLIQDVLRLLSGDAALRKVTVRAEVKPGPLPTHGDRVHLQQVLLNLIVNGMDAVAGNPPEERRVIVQAGRNRTGEVEVAVSDNGPGIPPDQLSRLFEPFFTTKPDGMGMGTSIARTIIQAHHGHIWAENNPEGGATFRFSLPIDEEPEVRHNSAMPKAEAPKPAKP